MERPSANAKGLTVAADVPATTPQKIPCSNNVCVCVITVTEDRPDVGLAGVSVTADYVW